MVSRRSWKKQPAFAAFGARLSEYFPVRFLRAFSRQTFCGSPSGKGSQCLGALAPVAKDSPTFCWQCFSREPRADTLAAPSERYIAAWPAELPLPQQQPFRCDKAVLPSPSRRSKRPCSQIARAPRHRAGGSRHRWQSERLLIEEWQSNLRYRGGRGIRHCHRIAAREPARVSKISRRIDMPEAERARLNRRRSRRLGTQRNFRLARTNQLVRPGA